MRYSASPPAGRRAYSLARTNKLLFSRLPPGCSAPGLARPDPTTERQTVLPAQSSLLVAAGAARAFAVDRGLAATSASAGLDGPGGRIAPLLLGNAASRTWLDPEQTGSGLAIQRKRGDLDPAWRKLMRPR